VYDIDKYKKNERPYKTMEDIEKIGKIGKKIGDDVYDLGKPKIIKTVERQAMPHMMDEAIEPLKIISSDVIGNIFDRVKFLEQRITELNKNVELRTKLHESIVKEIEKDIDDKDHMILALSDPNERRNLKLDISILRKERRHEDVQFWKDIMELTTELKQLTEEYETERKISSIFENLNGMENV